jgi:hypothetical protein
LAQCSRGLRFWGLSIDRQAEDATGQLAGLVMPAFARALPKPKGLPVTEVRGCDGHVLMADAGRLFPESIEQIARFL